MSKFQYYLQKIYSESQDEDVPIKIRGSIRGKSMNFLQNSGAHLNEDAIDKIKELVEENGILRTSLEIKSTPVSDKLFIKITGRTDDGAEAIINVTSKRDDSEIIVKELEDTYEL